MAISLSGCKNDIPRPDAFSCVLIQNDNDGKKMALDQWFWFCRNPISKKEIEIHIADTGICVDDFSKECKWIGTDAIEYNKAEKHYSEMIRKCQ